MTPLTHPNHTEPIHRFSASWFAASRFGVLLQGGWVRYASALLGLWLFISAFAWEHAPGSRMNTSLVGLFMLVSAITATGWSMVRHLSLMLALWLAFTTLAVYPDGLASSWNNLIVALLVIVLAELPDELRHRAGR
jgi:hypothetical protein